MSSSDNVLSETASAVLLDVARESIRHGLRARGLLKLDPEEFAPELRRQGASFVTLFLHHELRGCVGALLPWQALVADVAHNAHRAAFEDPRFLPVTVSEIEDLDVHISVLSELEPIDCDSERSLIAQLRPGLDGVVATDAGGSGTLLPAVWKRVADPGRFVAEVKRKAGLPAGYWSDTLRFYRYTVREIH
jgi:AmmeMemoRadiSam system protein A